MSQAENKTENGPINRARAVFAGLYFILSVAIVAVRFKTIFVLQPVPASYNFDRFLWCVASSCLAFAVLAGQHVRNRNPPYLTYLTYYPLILLIVSSTAFSVCHVLQATTGFVFYYLSFAMSAVLAFQVDRLWSLVRHFVGRTQ